MTHEEALEIEVGDRLLYSAFTNGIFEEGDEVILAARARDYNGLPNDTEGWFYRRKDKKCHGGNIQSFKKLNG